MFRRLRTKLAVLYAGLFGAAMLIVALTVYMAISANAQRVVRGELEASGTVFDRLWQQRTVEMQDDAELLSRDFGFREAVASQDTATLQSALENLRQRSGIDLAFSVGLDGRVTASDGRDLGADGAAIAKAVQAGDAPAGVAMIDGAPYQVIATPILSPTLDGWVVFAQRMDGRQMSALERLSAIPLSAAVLDHRAAGWISDSAPLTRGEQAQVGAFVDRSLAGRLGADTLAISGGSIALVKPLPALAGSTTAVLLLRYPLAQALAPYQWLLAMVVVIGVAGLALAFGGSWALALSVTRPVSALDEAVRRLQRGEAARVVVETRDEVGRLAESFNAMAETIGEREREITHLAMSDSETGLPNRRALEAELAVLGAAGETGVMAAAISIDRFAEVRGVIGYELAAALLRDVAARLAERAPAAMIGHLSSDTVGMILRASGVEAALAAVHELVAALEGPVRVGEATTDVAVTIGLAPVGRPAPGERSPLVCAAIAVAQARAARRKAVVFDAEAYGDPAANLSLMSQMLHAIEAGLIDAYYQPKYDIRRGRVGGVEALVRWRHPARGLLSPDVFVPLAEETGHIRALTDHVLARAIADQAAMRRAGHDLDVAVNISGRLLSDPDFAQAALMMTDGADGRVWFEITETAVIDQPERALRHVERFADAGVGVSIDDYGTGLSSLAYLREIRAEELKIDKAFILDLADARKNTLLVRSTIELAHSLGMKVTAEGVETNEAFALLAGMGCDFAQGFLIERAMPFKDVLTFLAEDRAAVQFG